MSYISIRSDECQGCVIMKDCSFPPEFRGRKCPCIDCLVKVMCSGEIYCKFFEDYENYIESNYEKD